MNQPPEQTGTVGGHEVTFVSMSTVQEKDKTVTRAQIAIDGGKVYEPALSTFPGFGTPIGTPSVRTSWKEDVFLQIVEPPETEGLGSHRQLPGKPGYTAEGAAAGASSVISGATDPARAVTSWAATMLHGTDLLGTMAHHLFEAL